MHCYPEARIVARGAIAVRWTDAPLELSDAQQRAVDDVWSQARRQLGAALHDSPILAYRGHHAGEELTTVIGIYVPYRYYFARQQLGDIGVEVDAIGVNGMTFISDEGRCFMVLGRRSPTVNWYPGRWECVPAGGLDRSCARPDGTVDFAAMLLEEFEEELCVPREQARVTSSFGFVYDTRMRTYDVCCTVEADCSRAALADAVKRSSEYGEAMFVAENDVSAIVERWGDALIPTVRPMIGMLTS